MIRDGNGAPTETNAPSRDTDCIEVVLAYPHLIRSFEEWLSTRGLYLVPIPVGTDDLPTYGVGLIDPVPPAVGPQDQARALGVEWPPPRPTPPGEPT